MYCLQATKTTNSGAKMPKKTHFIVFIDLRSSESLEEGIFKCIAVYTHKVRVSMQLESIENVPRVLLGSETQPLTTVSLCCADVITGKGLVDINCPKGPSLESRKSDTYVKTRVRRMMDQNDGEAAGIHRCSRKTAY